MSSPKDPEQEALPAADGEATLAAPPAAPAGESAAPPPTGAGAPDPARSSPAAPSADTDTPRSTAARPCAASDTTCAQRRRPASALRTALIWSLTLGLPGIITLVGSILYDSGAHAAWARAARDFERVEHVKAFVAGWPASTLAGDAFPVAARLYARRVREVEEIIAEARALKARGCFREADELLQTAEAPQTPAQACTWNDMTAWITGESEAWNPLHAAYAHTTRSGSIPRIHAAFRALLARFPAQSRTLTFPVSISSLPAGASVRSSTYPVGHTPCRVECYAGVELSLNLPGFFPVTLPPTETWDDPFVYMRLAPRTQWHVEGGGTIARQGDRLLALGADGVWRRIRLPGGTIEHQALQPEEGETLGAPAAAGNYVVLGGNGAVSALSSGSLRRVAQAVIDDGGGPVYVGPINDTFVLAGGPALGLMVLRPPGFSVDSVVPGAGPVDGFLPWRNGLAFRTSRNEILFWRRGRTSVVGGGDIDLVFTADERIGGIGAQGRVTLWREDGAQDCAHDVFIPARPTAAAAHADLLAIGTSGGVVQVISLASGGTVWRRHVAAAAVTSILFTPRRIFCATDGDGVHALDAATGTSMVHIMTEGTPQIEQIQDLLIVSDARWLCAYRL